MATTTHTPWRTDGSDGRIMDSRGVIVAFGAGMKQGQASAEVSDRRATRIVACVNGCTGLADPSALRNLIEAARNASLELQSPSGLRDLTSQELVAALAKLDA